jgi:hypothetical protein
MGITRFPRGVSSFGMPVIGGAVLATGNVFFVDSTTGDNNYQGTGPDDAFATLRYCVDNYLTAANGDVVIIAEGHTETLTTAITLKTSGVTIIGLGNGTNRPVFTVAAAIPGFNVTAANITIANLKFTNSGTLATAPSRMIRVAANCFKVYGCWFAHAGTTYKIYNLVVIVSGDIISFENCEFYNIPSTRTATHAQSAILNMAGTNVVVKGCRFEDYSALKTERWRTAVRGGAVASSLRVEDCTFLTRGIATATRAAGVSATTSLNMATLYCRAISPSANTAVGALFTPTYQYILESYNVAAVNKQNLLAASTSDIRFKTMVVYL